MKITHELILGLNGTQIKGGRKAVYEINSYRYRFLLHRRDAQTWYFNPSEENRPETGHVVTDLEELFGFIAENSYRDGRNSLRVDLKELLEETMDHE